LAVGHVKNINKKERLEVSGGVDLQWKGKFPKGKESGQTAGNQGMEKGLEGMELTGSDPREGISARFWGRHNKGNQGCSLAVTILKMRRI